MQVPESLVEAISAVNPATLHAKLKGYLWIPSIQFANVRAAIANRTFSNDADVVSELLAVDASLESWKTDLKIDWDYQTMQLNDTSDKYFRGMYHIYPSETAAEMWDSYRAVRILIHEIILQYMDNQDDSMLHAGFDEEAAPQTYDSVAVIREMSVQICASVPALLGTMPDSEAAPTERRMVPASRGLSLLWPLFVMCDTPTVDAELREWVVGRLRVINTTMGIRQAGLMAETLLSDSAPGESFAGFRLRNGIPSADRI